VAIMVTKVFINACRGMFRNSVAERDYTEGRVDDPAAENKKGRGFTRPSYDRERQ
jgi:hypothetical protein